MSTWSEFSVILKPSLVSGIGVFATHDIPKGTEIISNTIFSRKIRVTDVPSEFLHYCIFLSDDEVICPERFDRMEIGWYLNHSDNPNIQKKTDRCTLVLRDIHAGDELLLDYNQLNEPEHLKEAYYKPR